MYHRMCETSKLPTLRGAGSNFKAFAHTMVRESLNFLLAAYGRRWVDWLGQLLSVFFYQSRKHAVLRRFMGYLGSHSRGN